MHFVTTKILKHLVKERLANPIFVVMEKRKGKRRSATNFAEVEAE
jgi:hypothetical protein